MFVVIMSLILLVIFAAKLGGELFDAIWPVSKPDEKTLVDFKHEFKEKK